MFSLTYDSIQTLGNNFDISEESALGGNMPVTFPIKQANSSRRICRTQDVPRFSDN